MKILEELEETVKPEPGKHWIIPNAINNGLCITLTGRPCLEKQFVFAEIAISATTFTKFMGTIPPWIAARTLFITKDAYHNAMILRRLLNGRRIKESPEDLRIIDSAEYNWDYICGQIKEYKPRLILIDDIGYEELYNPKIVIITKQFTYKGTTTIINTPTIQNLEEWLDSELVVINDDVTYFTTPLGKKEHPITYAELVYDNDKAIFRRLAPMYLEGFEKEVWTILHDLGPSQASAIAAEVENKRRAQLVNHALEALHKKRAVSCQDQIGKALTVKIWTAITEQI